MQQNEGNRIRFYLFEIQSIFDTIYNKKNSKETIQFNSIVELPLFVFNCAIAYCFFSFQNSNYVHRPANNCSQPSHRNSQQVSNRTTNSNRSPTMPRLTEYRPFRNVKNGASRQRAQVCFSFFSFPSLHNV